ncbi:MAG: hypothetical protein KIS90_00945 [Phenylobacterium sp.]|nr:hypothetical protein [Phenylobacterium sp.]
MTYNFGRTVLILLAGSALTACATANDFAFAPTVAIPPPGRPVALAPAVSVETAPPAQSAAVAAIDRAPVLAFRTASLWTPSARRTRFAPRRLRATYS